MYFDLTVQFRGTDDDGERLFEVLVGETKDPAEWEEFKRKYALMFPYPPTKCCLVWLKESERGEIWFRYPECQFYFTERVVDFFVL